MNSQDILRNLGISFDLELDNSETYDYEISSFDDDYDKKVIDFNNAINFNVGVQNNLTGHSTQRICIDLCEIDNRPNDPNYIYSGITQSISYSEFTQHFNILDSQGVVTHEYENFILNNDVYTYTGFTNEVHYFKICGYSLDCLSTPEATETPIPTETPTPTPTIGCTLPHPETSTVFISCGGENFADSLSLACQIKDTFNSGGGCTGGTSFWTLYRDSSGVPSIGDPFYRYQNTCEVFTFLNGYSVLNTTDGYIVVNTLNGIVIGIENC